MKLKLALVAVSFAASAQTARVALRWKAVPGAVRYELEISRDPQFKQVVLRRSLEQPGYRWEELPNATYWWRVRSFDAEGRPSEWSDARAIPPAVKPPSLSSPQDGAALACGESVPSASLSFEPSRLLKEYVVEVASDAQFSTKLFEKRTADTRVQVPLKETGLFYWRVIGVDLAGRPTAPSPARTFSVKLAPPRPRESPEVLPWTPHGRAMRVPISWGDSPCASSYQVEYARAGGRPARLETREASASFLATAPGAWTWRVAAVDGNGKASAYSAAASVRLLPPGPLLSAPADGEVFASRSGPPAVELSWAPSPDAVAYRVEVSSDSSFLTSAQLEAPSPRLRFRPPGPGTYHWRVMALDANGVESAPSAPRAFTSSSLPPLAVPQPTAPAQHAVVRSGGAVGLLWEPVPGAARYELSLGSGAPQSCEGNSLRLSSLPDGEHRWRVRAVDAEGVLGPWSEERSFYVGIPPVAQVALEPLASAIIADAKTPATVWLVLRDARGRPVPNGAPEVTAAAGSVLAVREVSGRFAVRYLPPGEVPESGVDVLTVRERGFRGTVQLPLTGAARRLWAGARIGWNSNFGALSSPYLSADLSYRTQVLRNRLVLMARLAAYGGGSALPESAGVPDGARSTATVSPASLLVLTELPVGSWTAYGGAGPSVQLAFMGYEGRAEVAPALGAHAVAGLLKPFGPGEVSAEIGYLHGRADGSHASLRTGGLHVSIGYRLEL